MLVFISARTAKGIREPSELWYVSLNSRGYDLFMNLKVFALWQVYLILYACSEVNNVSSGLSIPAVRRWSPIL